MSNKGMNPLKSVLARGDVALIFAGTPNTVSWSREGRLPSVRTRGGQRKCLREEVLNLAARARPLDPVTRRSTRLRALRDRERPLLVPGAHHAMSPRLRERGAADGSHLDLSRQGSRPSACRGGRC
jgi:hypothetical protein